jgi:hypothetical protein
MVWSNEYRNFVRAVGILMCIAWASATISIIISLKKRFGRQTRNEGESGTLFAFPDKFVGCVLIASALLIYDAAVTAVFAEPDFRYRHMIDLQALLIAGLGVIAIQRCLAFMLDGKLFVRQMARVRQCTRAIDVYSRLKPTRLIVFVGIFVTAIYLSWILFMLRYTG